MIENRTKRWLPPIFVVLSILLSVEARPVSGQESGPTAAPASTQSDPQGQQSNAQPDRTVSLRRLAGNILHDEKGIFLFPRELAKGKHWLPTIGVLGVTAGLIASDAHSAPPFNTTNRFSGFNRVFSSANTEAFYLAVPAAMYGVGWLRKDSYAAQTGLLAFQAIADGFLLDLPFKGITGRKEPLIYAGNGPYTGSFFHGIHSPLHSGGFYSGHANAAMAVATVIARRYRNHRWVPFVAYGLAGAICFSRITRSDHFPGDVFFGGATGFAIARYLVLPGRN